MSKLRYYPPNHATVDNWRKALEAVACGPCECVWDGLKPHHRPVNDSHPSRSSDPLVSVRS